MKTDNHFFQQYSLKGSLLTKTNKQTNKLGVICAYLHTLYSVSFIYLPTLQTKRTLSSLL